ncbi:MAG: M48 family metallopeptidase [Candidatus Loosdrechtia sp.]|uniref:M48 family metallopeptidase n=1 Tax=Candidatus Loosdrechtia sp. TaxID=3101272 RepID=UPI003A61391F|nr:MAG: M48 family metallopeptidase [Candidatus Jettenia sp. AMX2]
MTGKRLRVIHYKVSAVAILIVLFLVSCAEVPITGRRQLAFIPQSQLLVLSTDQYNNLIRASKLSQDPVKTQMVRNVGQKIASAAEQFMRENNMEQELKNYQWEFNLIEDDKTINAFAMPGGKIAVYTGILPITRDEDGLAVIMGHEVAHAIANHGGERMSQLLLVQLGGVALSTALSTNPGLTGELLMAAYGAGTEVGVLLPYSRRHELEADRIGLILMARAGYHPQSAVHFWERMRDLEGREAPPEFLSTHPAPERRIRDIRAHVTEAMKYYNK